MIKETKSEVCNIGLFTIIVSNILKLQTGIRMYKF